MPAADLPAKRNRILFQLNAGSCPNKRLQALWTEHGEAGFTLEAAKTLDYDDPAEDHTEELETLCELCLLERPGAQRLWR